MMKVKEACSHWLKWLVAAALVLCAVCVMAGVPQNAYADEEAVRADASGVMKLNWGIDGMQFSRGSCFLINEDTVVTAYHCTFFSEAELEALTASDGIFAGEKVQKLRDRCTYTVTVRNDTQVGATLEATSERQDFAILKLDQPLNNHNALKFRDSSTVGAPSAAYALGFPANSDLQALNDYTSSDVTIKQGSVNKAEGNMHYLTDTGQECNGYFLQTDVQLSDGDSGGPMVDENGYVIGVSVASDDNYYFAAASSQIMKTLDDLVYEFTYLDDKGVEQTMNGGGQNDVVSTVGDEETVDSGNDDAEALTPDLSALNSAIQSAKSKDAEGFTEDTYAALTSALEEAEAVAKEDFGNIMSEEDLDAAQDKIDSATDALNSAIDGLAVQEASEGLPMAAIIGIIVGVIALIAIIVLAVVLSKRKKGKTPAAPTASPVVSPAATSYPAAGAVGGVMPTAGADETTIIGGDNAETTVLNQAASGGSLTRMSTNETVPINSAEFTIGRERSKVSYCLEGNTSISRVHARIVVRNGSVYLVDNSAANGTYVNGVKSRPGQEVQLKSGDIIMLADEKFRYNA